MPRGRSTPASLKSRRRPSPPPWSRKPQKVCFPNWHLKSDVKSDLFLAITTVLVQQFKDANLHMPATGFVERAYALAGENPIRWKAR